MRSKSSNCVLADLGDEQSANSAQTEQQHLQFDSNKRNFMKLNEGEFFAKKNVPTPLIESKISEASLERHRPFSEQPTFALYNSAARMIASATNVPKIAATSSVTVSALYGNRMVSSVQ
jgi:hypothetical protein